MKRLNKRVLLFGAVLALTVAFMFVFTYNANADKTPPDDGNWYIDGDENVYLVNDHTMKGEVTVNGTLTIHDGVTLEFDVNEIPYTVLVNANGTFNVNNSGIIKAKQPASPEKRVNSITIFGTANIESATIEGINEGLRCERTSTLTITNTIFKQCGNGIIGIGIQRPDNSGGSYDVDGSKKIQRWYVTGTITDKIDGDPVENAVLTIWDTNGVVKTITSDVNGKIDFNDVLVDADGVSNNPFNGSAKAHMEDPKDPKSYHIVEEYDIGNINNNIDNLLIEIETTAPDFGITGFSQSLNLMEIGDTNTLTAEIRNMGEKDYQVKVDFLAKLISDETYEELDSKQENVPADSTKDFEYGWMPDTVGNYNVKVEITPIGGTDPYLVDNAPWIIGTSVMQPPEIEITSPEVDDTVSAEIDVDGTYAGSDAEIHVWLNEDEDNFINAALNDVEKTWTCKLDTSAHYGTGQKIHAQISAEGKAGKVEVIDTITITLKNEPVIELANPDNNEKFTANAENYKINIIGTATKAGEYANDIENVTIKIGEDTKNVNPVPKDDTTWDWSFEWNIAQKTNPVKDGEYVINIVAEDNASRKSEAVQITITVDNTAKYSEVTIPKITITTEEPTEPVNDNILIAGVVEDDWEVKKIEAKVDDGDWVKIKDINSANTAWDYTWDVSALDKGNHEILFRAIDEEEDIAIIDEYYLPVKFTITKEIAVLPDLSVESIVIMNSKNEEITKGNNEDNVTIEVTFNVVNPDAIIQATPIYVALWEGENEIETTNKTIDNTIGNTFKITIKWTVAGSKGKHNLSIEVDKGNNLDETKETNNNMTVEFEITNDPKTSTTKGKKKDDGFIPGFGTAILFISMVAATSLVILSKRKK